MQHIRNIQRYQHHAKLHHPPTIKSSMRRRCPNSSLINSSQTLTPPPLPRKKRSRFQLALKNFLGIFSSIMAI